jgi:hypothetical protein
VPPRRPPRRRQVHRHIAGHDPGRDPWELAALQAFLDGRDAVPELDDAPVPRPVRAAYGLLMVADTLVTLARRRGEAGLYGDAQAVAREALVLYDGLADIRDEALVAQARMIARDLTPVERATDLIRIALTPRPTDQHRAEVEIFQRIVAARRDGALDSGPRVPDAGRARGTTGRVRPAG